MNMIRIVCKTVLVMMLLGLAACGGSGGGGGEGSSPAAIPAPANVVLGFAYATNFNSNNVSAYSIDASTGALTSIGAAVAAGISPRSVTVDPSGRFAYVANLNSNNVSAYTINASTGVLTPIDADLATADIENFAAGRGPASVTVDPSGKFAYVANAFSNTVSAYTIDASTGVLTIGATVRAGDEPLSVTVDPSGKFAYAANEFSDDVSAYTIDSVTGTLTPIDADPVTGGTQNFQTFVAAGQPASVTVDPSGKFAYVANFNSANVSAYTIDSVTGALTVVAGSPFTAGINPFSVTVDPSGKFAYVPNSSDVSAYTIDSVTGALTPIDADPVTAGVQNFAAGTGPTSVTFDPSGKFAYVANFHSNNVSAYSIDASTGVLTSIGAAVEAGAQPFTITTTRTLQ